MFHLQEKRFILKLYLAHCRVSKHWQRLKYDTMYLNPSRAMMDSTVGKTFMLPRAILPTRSATTSNTTISSALVICHLEVNRTVFSSSFMNRQTTLGR